MTNTICPTCGQELPTEADTFGTRVQAARVEQEMTRQDLATALGYERTSIVTRWESGQLQPTEIPVVESVAMALRVTPAWLLYGVQEPQLFDEVPMPEPPPEDAIDEDEMDGYVFEDAVPTPEEKPLHESPAQIIDRIRAEKIAAAKAAQSEGS